MADPDAQPSGFSAGRRWLTTLNLVLGTLALLALLVMLNYLATGYFKRFPLAEATRFKLSDRTLDIVKALTNDVRVTVFYQRKADVYTMVMSLLDEYTHANPDHIHVTALDYDKSPGEAGKLLARLRLGTSQKDFVAFECGDQHKICFDSSLSSYDYRDIMRTHEVRRDHFFGEPYFTADIFAVTHPVDLKAYFLTGHGERDPGDPTGQRPAPDASGYTKLAAILKDEISCGWQSLALSQTDSIPADCSLLIVPSGDVVARSRNLSSNEVFQIQTYLQHNGRLLALLNIPEGLDTVLTNWGVILHPDHVIDRDPRVYIRDGEFLVGAAVIMSNASPIHPIMKPLVKQAMNIEMDDPRPISTPPTPRAPGTPTFTPVAVTTTNAEFGRVGTNDPARPRQMFVVVAAVEQGVINDHDGTKIVVAGDANFLSDKYIDSSYGANHVFASLTLDWLLQRRTLLSASIPPRAIKEYKLSMTERQTTQARWLFLAAMPGSVLLLGSLVWLRRRS